MKVHSIKVLSVLTGCLMAAPAFAQVTTPLGPTGTTGITTTTDTTDDFTLPQTFNNPTVPTDFTGPGGSLGRAQGLYRRIRAGDAFHVNILRMLPPLVATDARFRFTGTWLPFNPSSLALLPNAGAPRAVLLGRIAASERIPTASFMPTAGSRLGFNRTGQMVLNSGAVLVRTSQLPVSVMTNRGQVAVGGETIALIAAFDGNLTVFNVHDEQARSIFTTLSSGNSVQVQTGEMLQIGSQISSPDLSQVSIGAMARRPLGNNTMLQLFEAHYPRAMKRFGLLSVFQGEERERIIKTAASIAGARRVQPF